MTDAQRIARIEATLAGLLWQHRKTRQRVEMLEETQERVRLLEQAILELDAAFRRSGTLANGDLALSRSPSAENPGRPSADEPSNLPA